MSEVEYFTKPDIDNAMQLCGLSYGERLMILQRLNGITLTTKPPQPISLSNLKSKIGDMK